MSLKRDMLDECADALWVNFVNGQKFYFEQNCGHSYMSYESHEYFSRLYLNCLINLHMTQKEYFIHLIEKEKGTSFSLTDFSQVLTVLCCMSRRRYNIIARAMINIGYKRLVLLLHVVKSL